MGKINLEVKTCIGDDKPFPVLKKWLEEALKIPGLKEPWAMVLSTSYKGRVSSRVVLLKQFQARKLFFYTNYLSSKGRDMEKNPKVAINFYWPELDRQIRIEGKVKKISRKKSVQYWKTRSRNSQLSQWISKQSKKVESRKNLEDLKKIAEKKFQNKNIPCPEHWGGYAFHIKNIEFWKNKKHRLHDRFLFEKTKSGWKIQRLFP